MEPDDDKTQTHIVLSKGTMVAHYRIIEKTGAGGMMSKASQPPQPPEPKRSNPGG